MTISNSNNTYSNRKKYSRPAKNTYNKEKNTLTFSKLY